ncbi:ribonuclease T2-like [Cotesia typhae]|uniref:ribonuclease T2-like n=1 Tax=Cotesia typhae TaxID=2053667 RepID=UPI003D692052
MCGFIREYAIWIQRKVCEDYQVEKGNLTQVAERIILTHYWTPALCYKYLERTEWDPGSMCEEKKWIIGEFMPSVGERFEPLYCNCSQYFDALQLSPIITDLKTKWFDYGYHSYLEDHWLEYGTCVAKFSGINNQLDYFKKSIELYDKFKIGPFISLWKINPGDKRPVEMFDEVFERTWGKKSQPICIYDKITRQFYLLAIRLCFDLSFNLIDCEKENIRAYPDECPKNESVVYLDDF